MNRIYNHPLLSWDSKIKILTRICQNEALAAVNNTLMKCRDNDEIGFENITIRDKVRFWSTIYYSNNSWSCTTWIGQFKINHTKKQSLN
jgi:hypothetical protein